MKHDAMKNVHALCYLIAFSSLYEYKTQYQPTHTFVAW